MYPCDFFVSAKTRLGNIMESGWRELRESPAAVSFAAKKCSRHLSRIDRMDFYDRISTLAGDKRPQNGYLTFSAGF